MPSMSTQPEDPSLWFTAKAVIVGPAVITFLSEGDWVLSDANDETQLQFNRKEVSLSALFIPHGWKLKPGNPRGTVSGYRTL